MTQKHCRRSARFFIVESMSSFQKVDSVMIVTSARLMCIEAMPISPSTSRVAFGAGGGAHRPHSRINWRAARPTASRQLPLHAANYQRGQGIRRLLSDCAVAYAPSARVLDAARLGQAQAGTGLAAFATSAEGLPLVDRIPRVSAGQLAASQLVWPARLLGTLTRGTRHPPLCAVLARPGCPPFRP
jgi:hypothetical protein